MRGCRCAWDGGAEPREDGKCRRGRRWCSGRGNSSLRRQGGRQQEGVPGCPGWGRWAVTGGQKQAPGAWQSGQGAGSLSAWARVNFTVR